MSDSLSSNEVAARLRRFAACLDGLDYLEPYIEAADEIDRLTARVTELETFFRNIVDSYGPSGYGAWDFVGIACNALGIPHPEVVPGALDASVRQIERLRAALEKIARGDYGGQWASNAEKIARDALAGAAVETTVYAINPDAKPEWIIGSCPLCGSKPCRCGELRGSQ